MYQCHHPTTPIVHFATGTVHLVAQPPSFIHTVWMAVCVSVCLCELSSVCVCVCVCLCEYVCACVGLVCVFMAVCECERVYTRVTSVFVCVMYECPCVF